MSRFKTALQMLVTAALASAPQASETNEAQAASKTAPGVAIAEACLDQNKPRCTLETRYLPDSDGSNATKIVLAYLAGERRTNSENQPYFPSGLSLPPNHGFALTNGYVSLPSGAYAVFPPGTIPLNPARLVSVERLKPTLPQPRSRRPPAPIITITEPTEGDITQPLVQIKGFSDVPLRSLRFDVINGSVQALDQQGLVTHTWFDVAQWRSTTNYFQCFDVELSSGTNTLVVRCEDFSGHVSTKTLSCNLQLGLDKTPPVISIDWPTRGRSLAGASFSARGQVDDCSTQITGRISAAGRSQTVRGIVERTGRFWVEHIPILDQTNLLTLTAVDAAGNSTVTNLPIIRSQSALTINPVPPNELWQLQVTVTGRVDPPDQAVWLNGKRAMVDGNGEWSVTGILTTSEGVAIFEAVAIPNSKRPMPLLEYASDSSVSVVPKESVSVAAVLNSNALTLNASQPTYGKFTLHLSGAAGRSYVISASTNLVDWDPILTNLNSGPTFDYNDTNAVAYGCRFFRVTPFR